MATVIDSLLIELGLDTSKFDTSAKKSVDELRKFESQSTKSFKNTQQGAKNVGDGFDKARNALISLGVALIGVKGFTNFAQQMTTTNAGLGRTAELFKMSARELDAWGGVLKSVGGDASDFQSSTQAIQQSLSNMQFGDTSLLESLGKLQVLGSDALSALDINKKELDIYKLADAFKQLSDAGKEQDAYVQAQAMGINRNYFMVLKQGGEAVHKLYDESYKLSGVNAKNTEQAIALEKAWGNAANAFGQAKNQVMDQLYPSLMNLAEGTQHSIEKFVEWDKEMKGGLSNALLFAGGLATLMGGFSVLGVSIAAQTAAVASWGLAIEGVVTSPWFLRFLGALGLLVYSPGLNQGEDEEMRKIHAAQDKAMGIKRNEKGQIIEQNGKPVKPSGVDTNQVDPALVDAINKAGLHIISGYRDKEKEDSLGKVWDGKNWRTSQGHLTTAPGVVSPHTKGRAVDIDMNEAKNLTDEQLAKYGLYRPYKDPTEINHLELLKNSKYVGPGVSTPAGGNNTNNTSSVNIQNVNVETQATDANGIAQSMKIAIENNSLINLGMVGNR